MAKTKVTGGYIADAAITSDHLHTTLNLSTKTLTIGATTVSGHLIPSANITYDLGSSTNRFRDIYLDGTTINLGGTELKKNSDGDIEFKSGSNFKKLVISELEFDDGTNRKKFKIDGGKIKTFDSSGSDDSADKISLAANKTDDLGEGTTNLYFTNARARGAISVSGNALSYNSSTGVLTASYEESPSFTGNITVSGTVDGRDIAADGTKLDGIESGATADQTQSDINALGITATGLSGTPNITVGSITQSGNLQQNNNNEIKSKDTGGTARTIMRVNSSNELEYGWSGNGKVKIMGGGSYTERFSIGTDGNATFSGTINSGAITSSGVILAGAVARMYTSSDRGYFVAGTNDSSNQHLYLGSYHGTTLKELTFSGSNNAFYPQTSEAIDLGLSTKKFKNLQLSGTISSGAITATTVNTGQGANELYAMNQNVRTTDSPTFNALTIDSTSSSHNLYLDNRLDFIDSTSHAAIWITSGGSGGFKSGAGAHLVFEGRRSTRNFYFKVGDVAAPQHIMHSNGYVGIGTGDITPSATLQVSGSIQGASFSDGTISGITFIDEDSFSTNSATRVPTQQSIKAYVDAQVAGVVDSAPSALNTLNELANALGDNENFSATTSAALGNRLRVDINNQGLTGTQQANAITNLGITATKAELNYVDGVTSNIQTQLDGKQASGSYLTGNQTITLTGDASGSGTTSIAVTVADDSHNHVISNVDGLADAFDNSYITAESASDLAVGWYTIATNTGDRATARFGIWDTDSGDHQSVTFYAAHHFGTDTSNTLTVLDNSYYSGNPFRYIRIKDGGTYDGAALQIYIDDATNNVNAAILGDNFQSSGWLLKDWVADATDPGGLDNYGTFGERSKVDLNNIAQGGFATTGEIYAGGDTTQYRVFHDTYHPNADTWTTARTITLGGDLTGDVSINGSANVTLTAAVVNDSHNHNHSDGNFTVNGVLQAGAGSNHISTSAAPFRWQRSSAGNTGQDDNVSVYVDDSNIYFTHNNDDDGDASGYHFRYMTGGTATNLLSFSSSTMTYKGQTVFHTGYHPNADTLTTARTIGGVSFNGSANINLPGVNTAGNQNTSGTAAGLSGTPNITVGTISTSGNINAGANINVQNNGILDVTTLRVRGDNDTGYSTPAGLTGGISLWSTGATTSQIMFKPTSSGSLGNHGFCTNSYNTYFVMDTTNRGWVFRNASTNTNVASISNNGGASFNNGIKINATTIVDSSRNLTYIGTIGSTYFSTTTNVNSTGAGGAQIPSGYRLGFDQSGTRSWTQYAAGGNLLFASGDGNGAVQANNFTASVSYKIGTTTVIDSARNVYATNGFVASNTWVNNNQPSAHNAVFSGYGAIGNRATFYITNGGGSVEIGNGSVHNSNPTATFSTSVVNLGANRALQLNGQTVIDSSRNLTNIGTISSGTHTITANGNAILMQTASDPSNYYAYISANYNYGQVFSIRAKGAGTEYTLMDWGDAVGLEFHGGAAQSIKFSSHNLSSIGTISSGAITSTGISGFDNIVVEGDDGADINGWGTAPTAIIGGFSSGNHDGSSENSDFRMAVISKDTNGGNTPVMKRNQVWVTGGISGQAYNSAARWDLGRWENNGTDARSRLDLYLADDSQTWDQVMTWRHDGTSTKVGIQTTTPSATLDVNGTINSGSILVQTGTPTLRLKTSANSNDPYFSMESSGTGTLSEGFEMWYVNNVGDFHMSTTYNDDAASLRFHTRTGGNKSTSNERFTINGNGNVDIVTGSLRMGTTTVIDSSRNLYAADIDTSGDIIIGETGGTAFSANANGVLYFGDDDLGDHLAYSIGTKRKENINGDYTKLNIDWHTGITLGASPTYGGVRFFNNSVGYYNSTTKLFSVGEGSSDVKVYNDLNVVSNIEINGQTVIDASRNGVFERLRADGGGLIMGDEAYSASNAYVGMKTSLMTGSSDYMIISGTSDPDTYISAKDGAAVNIRGGGNLSSNQISVPDGTTITATTSDFRVTGNVTAYASDKRLKTNIQTIKNPIEKIKKIRGVEFDWLENIENFNPKFEHETGVIAQEIEAVIPDAVSPAPFNEEYKTVDKEKIVALLIEGMKEQQELIEKLTARIEELEK